MEKQKYKRRIMLVDRRLQVGLSLTIVLLVASYFVLFCVLAAYFPSLMYSSDLDVGERVARVAQSVTETFKGVLLPLVLTFIFLALHVVILMHRVAGPAYRCGKAMEAIRGRNLADTIYLRSGDYLGDLAHEINEATSTLRQDLLEARTVAESLAEGSRSVASRTAGPAADQANELAENAERLGAILGKYRLETEADSEGGE